MAGEPADGDGLDNYRKRITGRVSVVLRNPETMARVDFRKWPKDDQPRCAACNVVVRIISARDGVVEAHVHGASNFPIEVLLNWDAKVSERRSNLPPGFRDRDAASVPGRHERG